MSTPSLLRTFCLATVLTVAACQDKATQLFETAQFEELQNNPQHARELYEQVVADHPNSEQAARARERLTVLKSESK